METNNLCWLEDSLEETEEEVGEEDEEEEVEVEEAEEEEVEKTIGVHSAQWKKTVGEFSD